MRNHILLLLVICYCCCFCNKHSNSKGGVVNAQQKHREYQPSQVMNGDDQDEEDDEDTKLLKLDIKVPGMKFIIGGMERFNKTITKGRWLVSLVTEGCVHCQKWKVELKASAPLLKGNHSDLNLGLVDSSLEKEIASFFNARGYPHIMYFENGEYIQDYLFPRNVKFVLKYDAIMALPPVVQCETVRELENFCYTASRSRILAEDPVTFLLVTKENQDNNDNNDKEVIDTFHALASEMRGKSYFAQTKDRAAIRDGFIRDPNPNPPSPPYIVRIERSYKYRYLVGKANLTDPAIVSNFVVFNRFPTVATLSNANYYFLTHSGKRLAVLFLSYQESRNGLATEHFNLCARQLSGPDNLYFGTFKDESGSLQDYMAQYIEDFSMLPRLVVLDAENGIFFEDYEIERKQGICAVVRAAMAGKIPFQREGVLGYPWRVYKLYNRYYPQSVAVLILTIGLLSFVVFTCHKIFSFDIDEERAKADYEEIADDVSTDSDDSPQAKARRYKRRAKKIASKRTGNAYDELLKAKKQQ